MLADVLQSERYKVNFSWVLGLCSAHASAQRRPGCTQTCSATDGSQSPPFPPRDPKHGSRWLCWTLHVQPGTVSCWADLAVLLLSQLFAPRMHHPSDTWSPWAASKYALPALVGPSASSEQKESPLVFGSWQGEGDSTETGTCFGVKSDR